MSDETHPTRHRVRIAQYGWCGDSAAATTDEVQVGIKTPWVEIDGHRFEAVVSVRVDAHNDTATVPTVELEVIGPIEIVYVDKDGDPLPGAQDQALAEDEGGLFDGKSSRVRTAS